MTDPKVGYERSCEAAVRAGVKMVQLRMKYVPREELLHMAKRLVAITNGSDTNLIVDDDASVAALLVRLLLRLPAPLRLAVRLALVAARRICRGMGISRAVRLLLALAGRADAPRDKRHGYSRRENDGRKRPRRDRQLLLHCILHAG